jgi:sugar phosphate isomerase/epimerase
MGRRTDIKLGCQTITWGDGQSLRFDEIFAAVKAAGFDGVEVGFRHIKDMPPDELTSRLRDHGLVLAASHIGGNLEAPDQAGGERSILEEVLDYLDAAGCARLMVSGLNGESADAVAGDLAMLRRSAETAKERGVQLLYHNHHWEFLRPGIIDAVLTRTPASLGLCPDLGWLYRAGVDVMGFLERNASRIGAVHFKDFATPGDGTVSFNLDTVPLGHGLAPLRDAAEWLRTGPVPTTPLWVIAEQDRHEGPPEEAVAISGRFLQDVIEGAQS